MRKEPYRGASKGNGGLFYYYRCLKCNNNYNATKAHDQITRILEGLSLRVEAIDFIKKKTTQEIEKNRADSQQTTHSMKSELEVLERRLRSLEDKFLDNDIEPTTYRDLSLKLRQGIALLKSKIASEQEVKTDIAALVEHNAHLFSNFAGIFHKMDSPIKREFLRLLFPGGLTKTEKGYRTTKNPQFYTPNRLETSLLDVQESGDNPPVLGENRTGSPYGNSIEQLAIFLQSIKAA